MPDLPERIARKIAIHQPTGCWNWTACKTATGYGRVWDGARSTWAHRLCYALLVGPIPDGLVLDHLCRNRACVNPDHLEPVTDLENMLRGDNPDITRARHRSQKFCKRGHPLFGANLYRHPSGRRVCRECHKAHKAAYLARRADVLLDLLPEVPS